MVPRWGQGSAVLAVLSLLPELRIAAEAEAHCGAGLGRHGACDPIAEDEAQQDGSSDASLVQLQAHARQGSVTGTAGSAKSQAREPTFGQNSTFLGFVQAEIQYELHMGQDPVNVKTRNKATLAIISLLGLGFCGIDRCCMGQIFIGFMKGMSFGGLFIWFIIDYVAIMFNCLFFSRHLNTAAWFTKFQPNSVLPAFLIVVIVMILKLLCAFYKPQRNMVNITALCRRSGMITMKPTAFEMRVTFARVDSDQDGFIDTGELIKAMADLGSPLRDTEIDLIKQKVPQDRDGNFKIDELVDVLNE